MSGNMDILENNFGPLHGQLIDNLGNCFFISGNRIGAEDDGIVWLNGNLLMDVGCHTGKCRHGLTLASSCNQNYLVIRIILHLINLDQSILRDLQISKFGCYRNNIDHTAAFYCNFSSETVCSVNNLLHTIHIGRKGRNDDSGCTVLIKKIIKYMSHCALGHGKSRSLRIGTLTHQCKNALLTNLRKTLQIDGISEYRCIIDFKVSCVYHNSHRRVNGQC